MTHKQLSSMIDTLLSKAERELDECKGTVGGDSWVVHMTTATICSAIADALMAARNDLRDH